MKANQEAILQSIRAELLEYVFPYTPTDDDDTTLTEVEPSSLVLPTDTPRPFSLPSSSAPPQDEKGSLSTIQTLTIAIMEGINTIIQLALAVPDQPVEVAEQPQEEVVAEVVEHIEEQPVGDTEMMEAEPKQVEQGVISTLQDNNLDAVLWSDEDNL